MSENSESELQHGMNCSAPAYWDGDCTCGLDYRKQIARLQAELAESKKWTNETMERLQDICDENGCPAGWNRIDFLRDYLRMQKKKLAGETGFPDLYAWLGVDELGSGEVGLKQGVTPAGTIPMVSISQEKLDKYWQNAEGQAARYGKRISLVRYRAVEVVRGTKAEETDGGA